MIAVIICTHNPRRDYLERTLGALRCQTLDQSQWELLVVDNNSDTPLVRDSLVDWHPNARVVREEKKGLAHARLCGIRETSGDLLVFVDDDNVLAPDYLAEACRVGAEYPFLGAWGAGIIEPEFEKEPTRELVPFLYLLALRKADRIAWGNERRLEICPFGAGIVVRRTVAASYCEAGKTWIDSINAMGRPYYLGGDDIDLAFHALRLGGGIGVFPSLRITHLIAARRLTREYFLGVMKGYAEGSALVRFLSEGTSPWRARAPRLLWLRSVLAHLKGRHFSHEMWKSKVEGEVQAHRNIAMLKDLARRGGSAA